MSGSGGGGYGGGFDGAPTACDTLVIETQISSPKADVVKGLAPGIVLEVALEQQGALSVVVLKHDGQVAGGIADPNVPRLRECIAQGTQYSATVRAVQGGLVIVRIAPIPAA